jgi:HD-GYP domain-containing protein (c-di-GMP phosphodiesterase class II)
MEDSTFQKEDAEAKLLKIAADADEFEGYARGAHASRIASLADALAIKFSLAAHDRLLLRQAALLHDAGEAAMNRDYIRAARALADDERADLRRHPIVGEQEAAKRGLPRAVCLLVRWHHEWWNGAGYPDALSKTEIPLGARILRAADTFDALTHDRPHRAALPIAEAKKYLSEAAGIELDPQVVKLFLTIDFSNYESQILNHESSASNFAASNL